MAFKQQEAIPTVLHITPKKLSRRLLTVTLATVVGSISLFLASAWIWRPTIVAPFCSMNNFAAAIILPFSANGPVNGADNPILIASAAPAFALARKSEMLPTTVARVTVSNRRDNFIGVVWSTVGIASCCLKAMSARENRPSHDDIELPACGRRVQGVKGRPFILALGAADAVISINVDDVSAT